MLRPHLLLVSYLCLGAFVGPIIPAAQAQQSVRKFSQFIVFGDSLSDTGNFAATTEDSFGLRYPGNGFNYADGRFTDDGGTSPAKKKYTGVWHEQLASLFFGIRAANPSLDGGLDYAFGDAETLDGQREVEVTTNVSVHIDNLNRQVSNYLNDHTTDSTALYIVWAGANDLFVDASPTNAVAAANREVAVIRRLAEAGAASILVNNLPPLGLTPDYSGSQADADAHTAAAFEFNAQLASELDNLETALADEGLAPTIYRMDVYDLFTRLTGSAGLAYGFTNITASSQDQRVNPDKYLFWDGVHPTTYGHFQLAAEAYTVLTGAPVVEISRSGTSLDRNGGETGSFLLTRTGPDLSQPLSVAYTVGGTATPGTDYAVLKDHKNIKAGKRTVQINLKPTAASGAGTVKVKLVLLPGDGYVLPVVKGSGIDLTD